MPIAYPDILSVADFNNSRVFISNGEQSGPVTFRDATDNAVIIDRNGMGAAVGDVDNDGDLDWFVTGLFGASETVGNRLYRNDGSGVLAGRDGPGRHRGRRLGLGRLHRGLQPRRPPGHLPHQRLGSAEPDR